MSSSNPLSIEELFKQLHEDIDRHFKSVSGMAGVTLRINSYSRLIKAHPENTHENPNIPSTVALKKEIDDCIAAYGSYYGGKASHLLTAKAYTRIIAGRK